MAKEFIVAIELGSSNIIGVAGTKNLDGSLSVLSVVKENSTSCISRGVVYNIDKTVQCLTNIIKRLEQSLTTKIAKVYVGVGGQSLYSVQNTIVKDLSLDTIVDQDLINRVMDDNRSTLYPSQEILDAVTQEYKVDSQYQLDPIGIQCIRLEANLLNILWRQSFYRKLNKCFDKAEITIAEMYLAPLALAESVLTEAEKRGGCVLVDLGAATTTVSVYFRGILRHLAVIPLGGNNITKDIASLQMDEDVAEKLKLKYASAYTDTKEIDKTLKYSIDAERSIESNIFIDLVEARVEEIIKNVWNQVPKKYTGTLLGGFILTGGGSNMKNIERAFKEYTGIDKIRVAGFVTQNVNSNLVDITAHNGMMNTILGLLSKGDLNCAGKEITNNLFEDEQENDVTDLNSSVEKEKPTLTETQGTGKVPTEAEKRKAEEEARKRLEEEAKKQAEAEEAERLEREKARENSFMNKAKSKLTNFFTDMFKEE